MAPIVIYVTGFRQHAGKTVTSLGLISVLKRFMDPSRIGYIKPVGQEMVALPDGSKVDKDALVIREFSGIPDIDMAYVSPVRVGSGFTKDYLDAGDREGETARLKRSILDAIGTMSGKQVIIAEGTGHPGVGGILGLSNADVGNLIGANVLFLSGGGIGKALDMLEVDLSYFRFKGARVRGIVFNKVIPDKIDQVRRYITEELLTERYGYPGAPIRIFGFLPEVDDLPRPSMYLLKDICRNVSLIGDPETSAWKRPCGHIRIISLPDELLVPDRYMLPGDLVLMGSGAGGRLEKVLSYATRVPGGIGGLIFTCGETAGISDAQERAIRESGIPAFLVPQDTATAEERIHEAYENTKLQVFDAQKAREIEELFARHFDTERFLETFGIR